MKTIQMIAYVVFAGLLFAFLSMDRPAMHSVAAQFGPRQQQRANAPASENEWNEVVQFMEQNCPNRMNFVQTRLANRPLEQENFKKRLIEMYRQLNGIKNDDNLKRAMVVQWRAADQVFGAQLQWREGLQQGDARMQLVAQNRLKEATAQLVDAEIQVKQARVQKLQAEVMDLMKRREQLANDRFKQELNLAKNPAPPLTGKGAGDVFAAPERPPESKK